VRNFLFLLFVSRRPGAKKKAKLHAGFDGNWARTDSNKGENASLMCWKLGV